MVALGKGRTDEYKDNLHKVGITSARIQGKTTVLAQHPIP